MISIWHHFWRHRFVQICQVQGHLMLLVGCLLEHVARCCSQFTEVIPPPPPPPGKTKEFCPRKSMVGSDVFPTERFPGFFFFFFWGGGGVDFDTFWQPWYVRLVQDNLDDYTLCLSLWLFLLKAGCTVEYCQECCVNPFWGHITVRSIDGCFSRG